jgi:hypothetical protein
LDERPTKSEREIKMPGGKSGKFDRCVRSVAAKGSAQNPHAVCAAALKRGGNSGGGKGKGKKK